MGHERTPIEAYDESAANTGNFITVRRGVAIGAAAITLGVAWKGGGMIGEALANNQPQAKLSSGEVVADRALIEPIDFECSAWSKWDVEARYDYQLELSGKEIPGFGGSATFEEPTAVMLQYCIKDADSYKDSKVVEQDGQTLVKIPIDNMYLNAQIPTGNKRLDINAYNGMKTGGGAAGVISGIAGLGCDTMSFGKEKLGELFGKESKEDDKCNDMVKKIDEFKRDFDTNTGIRAEDQLIADVRENAAAADWEDVKNIYRDKTKAAAVEAADGDRSAADRVDVVFVDKNGKPTDETPEFKDIFEDLRKRGLLENPDVEVNKTKFKAEKSGTDYVPEYFDVRKEQK